MGLAVQKKKKSAAKGGTAMGDSSWQAFFENIAEEMLVYALNKVPETFHTSQASQSFPFGLADALLGWLDAVTNTHLQKGGYLSDCHRARDVFRACLS